MERPPVPLPMLITRELSYDWHDAVAIVAQLIAQARAGGALPSTLPEFRLLSLEEGGAVTAVSPEPSMPAMPGAAQLLQQLLSGRDQPPPLRLYAMQAATSEPTPTIEAFAEELAKYERPGRMTRLATLYNQAFDAIGSTALLEAARDRAERPLTVKTAGSTATAAAAATAAQAAKKKPAAKKAGQDQDNTAFNAALVVILVAVVVGGGAWYYLQLPAPPAPAPVVEATPPAPAAPAPPRRAARSTTAGVEEAPAGSAGLPAAGTVAAERQLAAAREMLARQEYASASTALERVLDMLRADRSPQAEEIRRAASGLIDISKAAGGEQLLGAADRVYRSGDPGVTDPVPFSYLPPKPDPGTPPEQLQVLEVLINADGNVDSAKFVMNRPSFRNSWWTAAAKAWRFEPATKDGRPVRYVMRIVMDDSDAQR